VTAVRDPAQIDRDYAAVLRDGGAPLDAAEPEEIAAWVRASAIREQLIQALDNWVYLKRSAKIDGAKRLREAAQLADGDDWRHRLRDLSDPGDRVGLEKLAGEADLLKQPPAALADLGRSLFRLGSTAVAVKTLRKAQQRHPGDLGINVLLASVLNPPFFSELAEERILSDRAEAVGFCRAALAIRPGNPRLHDTLGFLLEYLGKTEQAEAEFRRAIELDPKDAVAHSNLGSVLQWNNKLEAAAELRRAIELDPKYSDAHMNLGWVLYDYHKLDEAAVEFRLVIDLAREQQSKRGAAAKYHSSVEYDPFFEEVNGHSGLANVLDQQGKRDEALAEQGRCIELAPKDPAVYFNRAFMLWDQGKLDDAGADCRRVIELSPKCLRAHRKLADVLKRQGKPEAAAPEYRTAARLFAEELVRRPEMSDRDWLLSEERYDGARSAAQASAGPGDAASGLDDKERARLRGQALDWLRADWSALDKRRQEDSKAGPYIQERFRVWKYGEELAPVRDAGALAKLPQAEREAWRKLWADVDALLAKVNGAKAP
jgi:Flp pilus assembly protein TadD